MSVWESFDRSTKCKMEEKFSLTRKSDTEFVGNHPLENFREGARGVYGGELIAQSLRAAWDSIEDPEFQIQSLHSYFLKAGSTESPMRYTVTTMSYGRNYCSKDVKCYQTHNNQLCFAMMASFTRNNNIQQRKADFAQLADDKKNHPRTKVPFEFSRSPHYTFDKYAQELDSMSKIEHTNGNLAHVIPPETWRKNKKKQEAEPSSRVFGLFFKVNDNPSKAKDPVKTKMIDFAFASDSFYLSTVTRAVLPSLDYKNDMFFRVSLDHSIHFHDTNFDPTEWMYLDYKFLRLSNDRVLVTSQYFTMDKRLVATVSQEAMCLFPLTLIENNRYGSYKL